MIHIIVMISRYVLPALFLIYLIQAFLILAGKDADRRQNLLNNELGLILIFDAAAFLILYLQSRNFRVLVILIELFGYIVLIQLLYRLIYRKASIGMLNNMCMLLSVGFVIQTRLDVKTAQKQLLVVALSSAICLIIPVFIRKVKTMRNLSWVYAILGILLLGAVFAFGRISGGANLSLSLGGISFQFSEFVKITFVFFVAGMLQRDTSPGRIVLVSVLAAAHVGILVLSRDLGAALIYFIAYIAMVYMATRKPVYGLIGLGGMAAASVAAYHLFAHVRVRVQVWRNPFKDYEGTGYQIVQALFGVCAGGWFGTGLFAGNPDMIPLAKEDFTFAAVCEELGILFGILLILLCMNLYLLIVRLTPKLSNSFYRLVAIGLGTEYAFQVFLTVGGTTKFIPMTGITLPLVSYGGSSVMCTMMMLSIIQGLYMIREDESSEEEVLREVIREQNERERRIRNAEKTGRFGQTQRTGGRLFAHTGRTGSGGTGKMNTGKRAGNTGRTAGFRGGDTARPDLTGSVRRQGQTGRKPVSGSAGPDQKVMDRSTLDGLEKKIEDETEKSINY